MSKQQADQDFDEDKTGPGIQDATVGDFNNLKGLIGAGSLAAKTIPSVIKSAPGLLGNETGAVSLGSSPFTTAVRFGGKIYGGVPGETHGDIMAKLEQQMGRYPDEINAFDDMGFLRDGKFFTRDEARKLAGSGDSKDLRATGQALSQGGVVQDIKDIWAKAQKGPVVEDSNLEGLSNMLKKKDSVEGSSDTAKGYADGGSVSPDQQTKLEMVLNYLKQAAGSPAVQSIADTAVPGSGALLMAGSNPTVQSAVKSAAVPAINVANKALGVDSPIVPPSAAPVAPPSPVAATPAPQASPAAQAPDAGEGPITGDESSGSDDLPLHPKAAEILTNIAGGDSDKLQALLGQLKDQQTRNKWANVLGVIGDTLSNIGQAKSGNAVTGKGEGLAAIQGIGQNTLKDMSSNVQAELANDPNSQTSKWAQSALSNAMNLQPGDPKLATLQKTPAAVILQQMPQLNDAFKLQVQREANSLQQNQANNTNKLGYAQLAEQAKDRAATNQVAQLNAQTQQKKDEGELNANVAKDTSVFNPLHWQAQQNLKSSVAPSTQAHPQDAAAVNWAHTHPTDPRAKQILSANGL